MSTSLATQYRRHVIRVIGVLGIFGCNGRMGSRLSVATIIHYKLFVESKHAAVVQTDCSSRGNSILRKKLDQLVIFRLHPTSWPDLLCSTDKETNTRNTRSCLFCFVSFFLFDSNSAVPLLQLAL